MVSSECLEIVDFLIPKPDSPNISWLGLVQQFLEFKDRSQDEAA
jgi:hypothetical protein